jgi:hypothetical protein
LEIFAPIVVAY